MIRVLRKRIILTAMIAVLILLILMFAVLNVVNYISMENSSDQILKGLASVYNLNPLNPTGYTDGDDDEAVQDTDTDGLMEASSGNGSDENTASSGTSGSDEASGSMEREPDNIGEVTPLTISLGVSDSEIGMNDIMRAAYYTVAIDPETSEAGFTDISHVADVSEEEAQRNALRLYAAGRKSGWDGHCKILRSTDKYGNMVYFFLDRQPELINVRRILLISLMILVVFFGLFLLLICLISKKLLMPVAENIEQQKNFVTNAGHEIKTPLAIIQANTEALELHSGENKWTSNIKDQITRLSILMNNMLTLAKAQEGIINLPKADIDLSALLQDFLRMFEEPAAQKKVVITEELADSVIINGAKVQVGQVISIILDNAVKYCAPDSVIEISLAPRDKGACLKTVNTCTCLPDCEPERLFERFYRPDVSRYSETSGNGIGLSAARAIMESLGGSITCSFIQPDKMEFALVFRR